MKFLNFGPGRADNSFQLMNGYATRAGETCALVIAVNADGPIWYSWADDLLTRETDFSVLTDFVDPSKDSGAAMPLAVVDQSVIATYSISGDGNEPNNELTLSPILEEPGWSAGQFTGQPHHVVILAMDFMQNPITGTLQRISPQLRVFRNGFFIGVTSDSSYIRHGTGDGGGSNTVGFIDETPGTNPVYRVESGQGSSQNDDLQIDEGKLSLKAVNKVTVLTP